MKFFLRDESICEIEVESGLRDVSITELFEVGVIIYQN